MSRLAFLGPWTPETKRGAAETSPGAARVHEGSPYWRVLKIPTMFWIIIAGALFNFNANSLVLFTPAFLSRYHGLNLKDANITAGLILGGFAVPGLLAGGWVVDRFRRVTRNARLLTPAIALLICAACIYSALNLRSGEVDIFVALMGMGWMLHSVYYSGVFAAV
jgi:sugar phosphate permease